MADVGTGLSVSKRHILCSEVLSVTSVMRKNSRWASNAQTAVYSARDDSFAASLGLRRVGGSTEGSTSTARREVQLMSGFVELNRVAKSAGDVDNVSLLTIFGPFLAMIRSPLSTGPITSAALAALQKLFVSGFVTATSRDLEAALSDLSNAITQCKFEATDAAGDEVVMFRIMAVIRECMCGPFSDKLGDVEVCEMLETVLTTCCQMRLSEILRRFAESTMDAICRRIFRRLCTLDPIEEENKLAVNAAASTPDELRMNVQALPQIQDADVANEEELNLQTPNLEVPEGTAPASPSSPSLVRIDYGLPSIIELMRVLINILDPNDRNHTDSTRLTALRTLNTILEVAGSHISRYQSLISLIQDHGCKYLFQLARSENQAVLYMALRVISVMFETMRQHLKLQQELFLAFTIDRLAANTLTKAQVASLVQQKGLLGSPRPSTPIISSPGMINEPSEEADGEGARRSRPPVAPAKGETRELMLEVLVNMARHPSFMVDLYANYDCDVNCEDLFDRLIDYLTKGVYTLTNPAGQELKQQPTQSLCLEMLLDFINHMSGRNAGSAELWNCGLPEPDDLLKTKSLKRLVLTGASRFNAKPKVGLSFLEENKLIYSDLSDTIDRPTSLARFLKSCSRIDKRLLGDFLARSEHVDILRAFIRLFDFKDKPVSDAIRELLESFRLPGEGQQIDRITQVFAEVYHAANPEVIKSQDAMYILAFSVILLNTDLHNSQNRKRMTVEDYRRNLRGVNGGEDFPSELLNSIYNSIRKTEIVMPEEHTGQVGFEYAWKELLSRTNASGLFRSCNAREFDVTVFKSVWKATITAIAFAFTTFDDDYTVQRAITGFRQCATLAEHFELPEVFDYVVVSLSQVTGLIPESLMTRVPHYPAVEVEGEKATVSSLSVNFGTNLKGQLAAVVLFTIINGHGNAIREGWTQIFEIFQTLFLHSLLPKTMLDSENFLSSIPLHGKEAPRPQSRGDGGLLSALSSYLLTPYNAETEVIPEATDSEVENTLCTIDCISACRLDAFYSQIITLDRDALISAIRSLEALAHERTVARLKQEMDELLTPNSPRPGRQSGQQLQGLPYDPASVYLVETMIRIVSRTPQYIEDCWSIVFEHISSVLSAAVSYSTILVERTVAGLWSLCLIIADKPSMRDQLYVSLDLLANLPAPVMNNVGEQVILGLVSLVNTHREVISFQTEWNTAFALIRNAMRQPAALRIAFDLLVSLASEGPGQCVTIDNFSGLVGVLDEYASHANSIVESSGSQIDRRRTGESPLETAVKRGRQAIDLVFELRRFFIQFKNEGRAPEQVWKQCCLPLLSALAKQSTNASREIRHTALINLQRLLLGQQRIVKDDIHDPSDIVFNRIIFPLIDELLRPQVFARDPRGIPETRLRASTLLCKLFMQDEINDTAKDKDIRVLWIQILDLLDRLMNVDKRDQLHEAIPESLKNVILVMNASGLLVAPGEPGRTEHQAQLWDATHERMARFLPGFLEEIIPRVEPPAPPPSASDVASSAGQEQQDTSQ